NARAMEARLRCWKELPRCLAVALSDDATAGLSCVATRRVGFSSMSLRFTREWMAGAIASPGTFLGKGRRDGPDASVPRGRGGPASRSASRASPRGCLRGDGPRTRGNWVPRGPRVGMLAIDWRLFLRARLRRVRASARGAAPPSRPPRAGTAPPHHARLDATPAPLETAQRALPAIQARTG